MFLSGSVFHSIDSRITVLEGRDFGDLSTRLEMAEADILSSRDQISDLITRCGSLENTVSSHGDRLSSLEFFNVSKPKRQDKYTGTTDANGDITISFPTGRYATAPHIDISYIFNNDNYGTFYNIKFLSKDSVTIRVMRNKNSPVLLGGNIDPDENLASTPVVIIATEY